MAENKTDETADICLEDQTSNLNDIKDIINSSLGAVVNIANKLDISIDTFNEKLDNFENRIIEIEESRRKQLLASDEQLDKIIKNEQEGMELMGTSLIANLLGTISLIYEVIGKLEITVSKIDNKLSIVDHRSTENLMEMRVIKEQQSQVITEMHDLKLETIKLREQDKKMMYRQLSIFTIIFIVLAGLVGVNTILNAIRGGA